jgi:hypothetical protein
MGRKIHLRIRYTASLYEIKFPSSEMNIMIYNFFQTALITSINNDFIITNTALSPQLAEFLIAFSFNPTVIDY